MKRFSIRALMAVVVLVAIGIAALRNSSDLWAGILLMATLATLGAAFLAVVYRREGRRAFALGFTLFAGGYLVLAMGPWFSEQVAPNLPTTQLLDYLHSQVVDTPLSMTVTGTMMLSRGNQIALDFDGTTQQGPAAASTYIKRLGVLAAPGTANYEPFLRVGHCLFVLLTGLAGGLVARRLQRTNAEA